MGRYIENLRTSTVRPGGSRTGPARLRSGCRCEPVAVGGQEVANAASLGVTRGAGGALACQGSGRSPVRWPLIFLVGGQQKSVLVAR